MSIASNHDQVPVDFELYLPEKWTSDAKLRRQARIPEALQFKTKTQLALDMLSRAVKDKLPKGVMLADSAYGTSSAFRQAVRKLRLHYAVGIDPQTKVWLLDPKTQLPAAKQDVRSLAYELDQGWWYPAVHLAPGHQAGPERALCCATCRCCTERGHVTSAQQDIAAVNVTGLQTQRVATTTLATPSRS